MTDVGDDPSVGGRFSTVFLTGVVGSEGMRWQTRLCATLFILVTGGIWRDDAFSTVHRLSGVTVMGGLCRLV